MRAVLIFSGGVPAGFPAHSGEPLILGVALRQVASYTSPCYSWGCMGKQVLAVLRLGSNSTERAYSPTSFTKCTTPMKIGSQVELGAVSTCH